MRLATWTHLSMVVLFCSNGYAVSTLNNYAPGPETSKAGRAVMEAYDKFNAKCRVLNGAKISEAKPECQGLIKGVSDQCEQMGKKYGEGIDGVAKRGISDADCFKAITPAIEFAGGAVSYAMKELRGKCSDDKGSQAGLELVSFGMGKQGLGDMHNLMAEKLGTYCMAIRKHNEEEKNKKPKGKDGKH